MLDFALSLNIILTTDKVQVRSAAEKIGRLDVLVNNSGISEIDLFTAVPDDISERIMSVNLIGAMNCA